MNLIYTIYTICTTIYTIYKIHIYYTYIHMNLSHRQWLFAVWKCKPWTSHMLGKHSVTELYASPCDSPGWTSPGDLPVSNSWMIPPHPNFYCSYCCLVFGDRVSCQAVLELLPLVPLSPKCYDYSYMPTIPIPECHLYQNSGMRWRISNHSLPQKWWVRSKQIGGTQPNASIAHSSDWKLRLEPREVRLRPEMATSWDADVVAGLAHSSSQQPAMSSQWRRRPEGATAHTSLAKSLYMSNLLLFRWTN